MKTLNAPKPPRPDLADLMMPFIAGAPAAATAQSRMCVSARRRVHATNNALVLERLFSRRV